MVSLNQLCENYLKTKPDMKNPTKESYKGVVKHLGEIDYKNVELVYKKICENESWPKPSTRISKLERVSTLLFKNEIKVDDYTKFIIDLKKQNNKQNNQRKIVDINTENLLNKNIDEFFLKMMTEYPPIRSDLCSIKLKNFNKDTENYFDGKSFVFNTLVKVNKKKVLELKEPEIEFVKSLNSDYLYDIKETVEDRNDHFCKYLKRISLKFLGEEFGIQKFRRRYITKHLNELVKLAPFELLKGAEILAKEMNTSISMMLSNYYGKMEFENVETKTKTKETETQTEQIEEQLEDGEYKIIGGVHYKKC